MFAYPLSRHREAAQGLPSKLLEKATSLEEKNLLYAIAKSGFFVDEYRSMEELRYFKDIIQKDDRLWQSAIDCINRNINLFEILKTAKDPDSVREQVWLHTNDCVETVGPLLTACKSDESLRRVIMSFYGEFKEYGLLGELGDTIAFCKKIKFASDAEYWKYETFNFVFHLRLMDKELNTSVFNSVAKCYKPSFGENAPNRALTVICLMLAQGKDPEQIKAMTKAEFKKQMEKDKGTPSYYVTLPEIRKLF